MTQQDSPLSASGIRDNQSRGSMGEFLKDRIKPGASLSIVSAYFTIYAFEALKQQLSQVSGLRFLFGEPRFLRAVDPERTQSRIFCIGEEGLELKNQLQQKCAARECADWIREKVQVRSIKQAGLLHGKMYHIDNGGIEQAIMGSSNFTVRGLGLAAGGNNIELNLEVNDSRDRRDLRDWFNQLWENRELVEDVKDDVLRYLEQLYRDNAPEFVYFKTLYHLFEEFLKEPERGGFLDEKSQVVDSEVWKTLFEFQKDGAKGAIHKVLTHNGCILADSVGLGKTYEALAVIKYFELRNDKVLVLCPKKLRENWTVYQGQNNSALNPFVDDRFGYTVLSHTDLSRDGGRSGDIDLSTINWGNYDLIVIDESHNFRNVVHGKRDEDGKVMRKSRYERLIDDIIRSGVKTKVLLISATPVNNNLSDLRNQIYLITENEDKALSDSLDIASIKDTLNVAQKEFTGWARGADRKQSQLLEELSSAFFKLLDGLTIARSRKHILKYYSDSIEELGGFPERLKPISIYPSIDLQGRFASYDKLNDEISQYRLSLFNPSAYILKQYQQEHQKRLFSQVQQKPLFSQVQRESYLIGMMKVNFLKRLESSVHSFSLTLQRTLDKIETLEKRIERFKGFRDENPDLDFDDLKVEDVDDEELQDAMQVGEKLVFPMAHLDIDAWLVDLKKDRDQLYTLCLIAKDVSPERDAKLAELKKLIERKVRHPTTDKRGRPNRKVLVFTAFADTAAYLYDQLRDWAHRDMGIHLALVTGGAVGNKTTFGKNDFNHILTHFAPIAKHRDKILGLPQMDEINLLIASDCISEGQNLQDCDYLINYDIHWNPVRVIQRFGRIDRIGSTANAVQLVNFWPTQDLDKYITLKARVEARMALVDMTATQDDNILNPEQIKDLIQEDLRYRDKQLLRLREEVLDLEDVSESVTLTDFTLDDFRMDLARYIEANRQTLEDAPLGLYAVVPPDPRSRIIEPGVVFCLRQKGDTQATQKVNPLRPYYLVYVRHDVLVRFGFAQPRQILEMFRLLCAGQTAPDEALCSAFDRSTCNGSEMSTYNKLLSDALLSIEASFDRRSGTGLQAGRGGQLVPRGQQPKDGTDMELVTWLVIQ